MHARVQIAAASEISGFKYILVRSIVAELTVSIKKALIEIVKNLD